MAGDDLTLRVRTSDTPEAGVPVAAEATPFRQATFVSNKAEQTPNSGAITLGPFPGLSPTTQTLSPGEVLVIAADPEETLDLSQILLTVAIAGDGVVVLYALDDEADEATGTRLDSFLLLVRKRLRDETAQVFSDQELYQFTLDAVADYSPFFPQRLRATFMGWDAKDQMRREYDLKALPGLQRIERVRFPAQEDPPVYLDVGDEGDPDGFYGLPCWTTWGEPPDRLVLGVEAAVDDELVLFYTADHALPNAVTGRLTVPDRDLNLLASNVVWRAVTALRNGEAGQPSLSIPILAELVSVAIAAKKEYDDEFTRRQRYGAVGYLF